MGHRPSFVRLDKIPQGLKPSVNLKSCGTTEVVPFPSLGAKPGVKSNPYRSAEEPRHPKAVFPLATEVATFQNVAYAARLKSWPSDPVSAKAIFAARLWLMPHD